MNLKFVFTAFFILLAGVGSLLNAQSTDIGITPKFAGGEVTSIESGKIVLQTKDGAITVMIADKTVFKKVQPDNPKLASAADSTLSEIGVGDKLLVTGEVAADKKSVPAKTIYLMTKSAITEKQNKESEQWKTRGISGRVTNLNLEKNEITVAVRSIAGETSVIVSPKDNSKVLRYANNSIKYSEAKPSSIKEISVGDSVRALGDKSADGTSIKAEEIISGSFQTVGGKVKSIDAAKNEVVIEDLKTKKDVTIIVGENSTLKKFPAEMAQRMAQFQAGGGNGGMRPPQGSTPNNPPNNQTTTPNADGQQQTPGQRGGGRGMRGGDINEMFERLPVITVADLKAGDMIAVSSTKTTDPTKITAIRLLAGVEPFLTAPQTANGSGGRGRGGQDSSFSIPGLDGFSAP